jgi:hypothetical protein
VPNLLPIVMEKNNEQGLNLTFSQMKKSARRFEKRCDGWLKEDAEAYVLAHSDPTGEIACGFRPNPFAENAARRLAA